MTIRDQLDHHLRRAALFCWTGTVAGAVGVFGSRHRSLLVISGVICAFLLGCAYYYMSAARCRRCRTRVLWALGGFGFYLRVPAWYRSCPSCGLLFEAQRDDDAKA